MSKFIEHFGEEPDPNWRPEEGHHERWLAAKAAWNAATLNAVEICKYYVDGGYIDGAKMCAEAIEQEQCE